MVPTRIQEINAWLSHWNDIVLWLSHWNDIETFSRAPLTYYNETPYSIMFCPIKQILQQYTVKPHLSGIFAYPDTCLGTNYVYRESDSFIRIFCYPDSWLGNRGVRISEGPLYTFCSWHPTLRALSSSMTLIHLLGRCFHEGSCFTMRKSSPSNIARHVL